MRSGSFADERRGSRHKRGYGSAWDRIRAEVKRRANGLCEPCLAFGYTHAGHECDHVISKAEWQRMHGTLDGVDEPTNLQLMHRDCHAAKTVIDRMRANGADVPPWQPQPLTPSVASAGAIAGPGASLAGGPGLPGGGTPEAGRHPGGAEKSGGAGVRTVHQAKFSGAGNSTGGGIPGDTGGAA